jgi:sensor histidine kinase YesM
MIRQFYKIIILFCLCCCKYSRKNEKLNSSRFQADTIPLPLKIRAEQLLLFDSDNKTLGKFLDSLKPLIGDGHPHLLFYWYELKDQQYFMAGNIDSSTYCIGKRQDIALKEGFKYEDVIALKVALTRNLVTQNKVDSALHCAQEGYYIARKNNYVSLAINYHLFEIYSAIGDEENAKKYLFEGYAHCYEPYFKVFFSAGMAKYYEEKGQPDSALYYFRYLEKDTVFKSRQFKASRDENMGVLLTSNGQPEEGLSYLLKAIPVEEETGQINGLTMLNLAICYSKLKQFKLSFFYLDSAAHYGDTAKDLSLARQISDLKAANHSALRQFNKAYSAKESAFNLYKKEKDTLLAKNARDLETRYHLREKEDKISSLANLNKIESKISRQQKIIIFALATVMALLVTIAVLLWRRRKMQIQIREAQLTQQLLRSQMEPHFIFNTLAVLKSFISNERPERSNAFLDKFSSLLRINLENARDSLVLLKKEVEALRNYLDLHAMSFDNLFTYHIEVYLGYEEDNILIPPMLLQPFVENSIFHGFADHFQNGLITVKIERNSDMLHCVIEDNGSGLSNTPNDNGKRSLSTVITRERLVLLGKQMGKTAKIVISDRQELKEGRGVRVTLDIPIVKSI